MLRRLSPWRYSRTPAKSTVPAPVTDCLTPRTLFNRTCRMGGRVTYLGEFEQVVLLAIVFRRLILRGFVEGAVKG